MRHNQTWLIIPCHPFIWHRDYMYDGPRCMMESSNEISRQTQHGSGLNKSGWEKTGKFRWISRKCFNIYFDKQLRFILIFVI